MECIAKATKGDTNTIDFTENVYQDINQKGNQECSFDSNEDGGYKSMENSPDPTGNYNLSIIEESENKNLAIHTELVECQEKQSGSSFQLLVQNLQVPDGSSPYLADQAGSGPFLAAPAESNPFLVAAADSSTFQEASGSSTSFLAAPADSNPFQAVSSGPSSFNVASAESSPYKVASGSSVTQPGASEVSGAKNMPRFGTTNAEKGKSVKFNLAPLGPSLSKVVPEELRPEPAVCGKQDELLATPPGRSRPTGVKNLSRSGCSNANKGKSVRVNLSVISIILC